MTKKRKSKVITRKYREAPDPNVEFLPTTALPGTDEHNAVLRYRLRHGLNLVHPLDALPDVDERRDRLARRPNCFGVEIRSHLLRDFESE